MAAAARQAGVGAAALLRRSQLQLPTLHQASAVVLGQQQPHHQQQPPQQQSARGFAADAGDGGGPMIIPAESQRQQQQQPAVLGRVKEVALTLPEANRGPWQRAVDKTSGGSYWWNATTDVTTPVGAPKPDAWVAVVDEGGSEYFWNKQTNETTAVGEPLPGPEGRLMVAAAGAQQQQPRQSAMGVLGNSLAMGFGVGLMFAVVRLIF